MMHNARSLFVSVPVLLLLGCEIGYIELDDDSAAPSGTSEASSLDPSAGSSRIDTATTGGANSGGSSSGESSSDGSSGDGVVIDLPPGQATFSAADLQENALFNPTCLYDEVPGLSEFGPETECVNGAIIKTDLTGDVCSACQCVFSCEVDEDCQHVDARGATVSCLPFEEPGLEGAQCAVPCEQDSDCPSATRCLETIYSSKSCTAVEERDLECAGLDGDDPCDAIDDEAACNAVISGDTRLRCHWVEEQIFGADGVSACEPVQIEGRCLLVTETEDWESELACGGSCDTNMVSYWEEIGPSTHGLVDLPCVLRPFREAEMCAPDDSSLLCGCGALSACE